MIVVRAHFGFCFVTGMCPGAETDGNPDPTTLSLKGRREWPLPESARPDIAIGASREKLKRSRGGGGEGMARGEGPRGGLGRDGNMD